MAVTEAEEEEQAADGEIRRKAAVTGEVLEKDSDKVDEDEEGVHLEEAERVLLLCFEGCN